jgi:hypothetical protein
MVTLTEMRRTCPLVVRTLTGDVWVAAWDESECSQEMIADALVRLNAPAPPLAVDASSGAVLVAASAGAGAGAGGTGTPEGGQGRLYADEIQVFGQSAQGESMDVGRMTFHTYLMLQVDTILEGLNNATFASRLEVLFRPLKTITVVRHTQERKHANRGGGAADDATETFQLDVAITGHMDSCVEYLCHKIAYHLMLPASRLELSVPSMELETAGDPVVVHAYPRRNRRNCRIM